MDENTLDSQDLYSLLDVIEDPQQRVFRHEGVVQGQGYKYKVTAVSETGEGTASEVILIPAEVPLKALKPLLLDDCSISWPAENGSTKALCSFPQNYQLAVASVDVRSGPDILSARVTPFVTVLQGTILEVAEETLGSDGRLYLSLPTLGGWLYDDTVLQPSSPLALRLPALKFSWTWPEDEVRALGGLPLSGWHVYRSADGVNWPSYDLLAASARNHSFACGVAELGLPFWVRLAAVNARGAGAPSEPLKLRCSLPPGEQPAPTQLESDLNSVVLGFNPSNLHGAELLWYLLSYAQVESGVILEEKLLTVRGDEQRVSISGLLPFANYVFKVQVVTEVGTSLDPGWQSNMSTNAVALLDAPHYIFSDGTTLRFGLSNLSQEWPEGEVPGYNIYITADDRSWPTQPTAVTDSLIFDHNCLQTPDYAQLDNGGNPTIVDQSYNFVYVKLRPSKSLPKSGWNSKKRDEIIANRVDISMATRFQAPEEGVAEHGQPRAVADGAVLLRSIASGSGGEGFELRRRGDRLDVAQPGALLGATEGLQALHGRWAGWGPEIAAWHLSFGSKLARRKERTNVT